VHSNQLSYTPLNFILNRWWGIYVSGCENKPFLEREDGEMTIADGELRITNIEVRSYSQYPIPNSQQPPNTLTTLPIAKNHKPIT